MEAIVLAGGLGTRIAKVVKDVPKPMAPISDKPFLEYIIDDLINKGINKIILAVGYKKEYIIDYFGNSYKNIKIVYSDEDIPLFTGGAIKKSLSFCEEKEVFVVNGDTYFDVDLQTMLKYFKKNMEIKAGIAVKEMENFYRYGKVDIDSNNFVLRFNEKQFCEKGYINGGIYIIKNNCLDDYPQKFSLENDFFPRELKNKSILAYRSDGFFIDIGIPEDYKYAQTCLKEILYG